MTTGGAAYCWGANGLGQLGNGTTTAASTTPVPVSGGLTFMTVSGALYSFTCGVTTPEWRSALAANAMQTIRATQEFIVTLPVPGVWLRSELFPAHVATDNDEAEGSVGEDGGTFGAAQAGVVRACAPSALFY